MAIEKSLKVTKSNDLNQANFSDFSLSCYRVLLNLISKIQRHDVNGELVPLTVVSRECSLSVAEYAKEFNIEPANAYDILKFATDKLMKTSFSIQKEHGILKINVCSQAYYRKAQGRIDIRFTEEIIPHLAALTGNFTMYNLNVVAGFSSIYTTRFYELIMQFKTMGELKVSVKNLRFHLGCVTKYKLYKDFKKYTFAHAIEEINQQWTLDIVCNEVKTGRAVTDLIFRFNPTFRRKAFDPVRQKMRTEEYNKPKRKHLTDEERRIQESKRLKQKEYRERHNAKKDDGKILSQANPDQQELPISIESPKTFKGKFLKTVGAEPEHIEAAENGTSHIEASKKVITRRVKKVKAVVEKTADDVRAIIKALMEEDDITETQATIKAIKLKLI